MKKNSLHIKGLNQTFRLLAALEVQVQQLMKQLLGAIDEVEQSHRNIVAAHKAHRTMAEKRTRRSGDKETR
jgi:hypothetical protein